MLSLVVAVQTRGVVSGDLDVADAERRGAVLGLLDVGLNRGETVFVIRADGHTEREKDVIFGRPDADAGACAYQQRANV